MDQPHDQLKTHRFSRLSSQIKLVETIALQQHITQSVTPSDCSEWHVSFKWKTVNTFDAAQKHLFVEVNSKPMRRTFSLSKQGNVYYSPVHYRNYIERSEAVRSVASFIDNVYKREQVPHIPIIFCSAQQHGETGSVSTENSYLLIAYIIFI